MTSPVPNLRKATCSCGQLVLSVSGPQGMRRTCPSCGEVAEVADLTGSQVQDPAASPEDG